jgi:transaldolase/glucose-6-phosphate isomerase
MSVTVSVDIDPQIMADAVARWEGDELVRRIWHKDPTVWFDPPRPETSNRLGWLNLPTSSEVLVEPVRALAEEARRAGVTDVVLCGMGGSSLAPEVFAASLPAASAPRLTVIDSTHPDAVSAVASSTDPAATWYVVSSKSGGTLETMSLFRFFWSQADAAVDDPGDHFIAVTDPGSSLAELAEERGFRAVFLADPDVGGRYSALSAFGLVPAGLVGIDIGLLLDSGREAARACDSDAPIAENPGFAIGVAFGNAGGVDVPTLYFDAAGPATALPAWIEQLIAESTGKENRGILPVAGGGIVPGAGATVVGIGSQPSGTASVSLRFDDSHDIGGAMFLLEFATAVAGEIIGIQPFDQPDVQLAKTLAHDAMEGRLATTGPDPVSPNDAVSALSDALAAPAYVAIQAYLASTVDTDDRLAELARVIAQRTDRYAPIGYGPRFLHSTGQLHKGGPAGGVFIQLLDRPSHHLEVPESGFSFNSLISAQAAGDRAALVDRGREVVAIELGDEVSTLDDVIDALRAG